MFKSKHKKDDSHHKKGKHTDEKKHEAKKEAKDDVKQDDFLKQIEELTNVEKELKGAEEKIKHVESRAEEMNNAYKRALADLENFRRRSAEEKADFVKYAASNLLLEILPCLDNFKKALEFVPKEQKKENWVEGLVQSVKFFEMTLEKQGVEEIKAVGKKLDPNFHEAVLQGPGEKDKVLEEMEKGYTYNGKVIKHSKVKVGDGGKN